MTASPPPADALRVNAVAGKKGFVSVPLADRFWAKVIQEPGSDCWLWMGSRKSVEPDRAYGMVWVNGRNRPAAKVAWELTNRQPFPEGMMACHTCDNPPCVNPRHVFPGTMRDNLRDAAAKGRTARGAQIITAHLTPEIVREIRRAAGTDREIGLRFGVPRSTIYDIRNRRSWRHVL